MFFEIPPKNAAPVAAARNCFSFVKRNSFAAAHITANNMKISPRTANACTAMNQSENKMILKFLVSSCGDDCLVFQ